MCGGCIGGDQIAQGGAEVSEEGIAVDEEYPILTGLAKLAAVGVGLFGGFGIWNFKKELGVFAGKSQTNKAGWSTN